jgi:hypothetical protein
VQVCLEFLIEVLGASAIRRSQHEDQAALEKSGTKTRIGRLMVEFPVAAPFF